MHAALVLVIELGEAGGELARAGAGGRHHDERAGGLDVVVLAEALVGDDVVDVGGVAVDEVVAPHGHAHPLETALERLGVRLPGEVRDADAADHEAARAERVHEAQRILLVGDADVGAALGVLDVVRVDDDDRLDLVAQALEHADLGVGLKARQHAARVIVVKELAAELEVELAAELPDALADLLRLEGDVLVVVKSDAHLRGSSLLLWAVSQQERVARLSPATASEPTRREKRASPPRFPPRESSQRPRSRQLPRAGRPRARTSGRCRPRAGS